MKHSVQLAVVGTLLLASLSAKAMLAPHTVPVNVQEISYNSSTMMVTASGMLPNVCTAAPQPELRATSTPNTLELYVQGTMNSDNCIDLAVVGNSFELAFDIRSLKFNIADLHLNPEATYRIVGAIGFIAEV
jgi:hypothetical protein